MDYTTDTSAALEEFLAGKLIEAKQTAANAAIDVSKVDFCESLRALDGKAADPHLTEQRLAAQTGQAEAETLATNIEAKLDAPPNEVFVSARIGWLNGFVAAIENEHAQHTALIELATAQNATDQVEASVIAQLVIEAAHAAALSELATLST